MAGVVLVGEKRVEKSSEEYAADAAIRIKGQTAESRYVGRGGLKLEKALEAFGIDPAGFVCLDIGASTGGFTDCLLQHGASKVYAIDVGTNQLAWKIRTDERVVPREKVNARSLKPDDFDEALDLIVMDVSFISVTKIIPALGPLLKDDGRLVILIKPQFEVGKGEVGKGGIVRESEKHTEVVERVKAFALGCGLVENGIVDSPILGADGNKEFLAVFSKRT